MNYAIIAAGEGTRLIQDGIILPKPLVELNGVALIDRLIAIFSRHNASSVSIIINEQMEEVRRHVEQIKTTFPVHWVVRSTPGSMHSFFELIPFLQEEKFCLTTVDTVFNEAEFAAFIRAFEADDEIDGLMAVTTYADDDRPLYISVNDEDKMITGFGDTKEKYISGGIYCLTPKSFQTLNNCLASGMSRMRNFQQSMVKDGLKLKAYLFEKIIDVDHASDIDKAEKLLASSSPKLKMAAIRRDTRFSPNHILADAAIFDLTVTHLIKMNCEVTEYAESEFCESPIDADVIFNMARDVRTIQKLQELETQGKKVINSGYGIENCTREKMTGLLNKHAIPQPKNIIVPTNKPFSDTDFICNRYWVKKGCSYIHYENVTYAATVDDVENILCEYALHAIPIAVINEHIEGDWVKFYGVRGSSFFHWFYPTNDRNHRVSDLEAINGRATGIPFDVESLKEICNSASSVLNVPVYGGDCVIDKIGNIYIIDFNDWPSFAACKTVAAFHIAQCIYEFATK
ncbi:hypothetical protein FACS1894177_03660 [Bacteroidia bacterium]|nr:hypothetical protein FACS1894177_03660 [Bacteroidia bacterium]